MSSKLQVFNGALLTLGSRKLASLTENRESRRVMDDIWNRGGVRTCLSMGLWNFAIRTAQLDYSPSIEPDFGFRRAVDKPTDWVRTAAMCSDEYFNDPLIRYSDERQFIYSDLDTVYAKWVSDSDDYGGDLSLWPENFSRMVEHWFAHAACERLTQGRTKKLDIAAALKKALAQASSTDAMDEPTKFLPAGNWSRSRHRGINGNRDRGSGSGPLIG